MSRRRYRTTEACSACGRMISNEQLASHERSCPAWRRNLRERQDAREPVEASETLPEGRPAAPGATGGPPA
jgi:hypothetical protein